MAVTPKASATVSLALASSLLACSLVGTGAIPALADEEATLPQPQAAPCIEQVMPEPMTPAAESPALPELSTADDAALVQEDSRGEEEPLDTPLDDEPDSYSTDPDGEPVATPPDAAEGAGMSADTGASLPSGAGDPAGSDNALDLDATAPASGPRDPDGTTTAGDSSSSDGSAVASSPLGSEDAESASDSSVKRDADASEGESDPEALQAGSEDESGEAPTGKASVTSAQVEDDAAADGETASEAALEAALKTGWVNEKGSRYYYDTNGTKLTGSQQIDGAWYYFDPAKDGAMSIGLVTTGTGDTVTTYYFDSTTGKRISGERQIGEDWYYFDPSDNGAMAQDRFVRLTGSYLANGPKTVYYGATGAMTTGEEEVGGSWYYLDPFLGGARAEDRFVTLTGSYLVNGPKTVYYDGAGKMFYGEREVNGDWYYLDPSLGGARAESRFVYLDGAYLANGPKTVYYDADGTMATGERQVNGSWYYLDPVEGGARAESRFVRLDGSYLATGPKLVYYDNAGRMVFGSRAIEGRTFWFDPGSGATDYSGYLRWRINQAGGIGLFGNATAASWALSELDRVVDGFHAQGYYVGYVMMDLTTGKGISLDPDGQYYSASTVKGPYVASLYEKVFGASTNARPYYWDMFNAIRYSDNDEYIYLRNTFGSWPIHQLLADAEVSGSKGDTNYVWYSPRELGKLWIEMFDYFEHGVAGQECANLYGSSLNSAIYQQLGGSYVVRSKPGWYPTEYPYTATNDAGIVYAGSRPYLIVALSNAPQRFDMLGDLVRALDNVHSTLR